MKFSEPKIEEKIYFKETKCKTKTQKATKLGKYAKQRSREPKRKDEGRGPYRL